MNYTFRDCRSKVNITDLLCDLGTNKQHCKLSTIQLFFRLWRHRQCHVATLKILRFLLKTHCRRRGWWYHVPHSSCDLQNPSAKEVNLKHIETSGSVITCWSILWLRMHWCFSTRISASTIVTKYLLPWNCFVKYVCYFYLNTDDENPLKYSVAPELTHWGLVTPFGDIDLSQDCRTAPSH